MHTSSRVICNMRIKINFRPFETVAHASITNMTSLQRPPLSAHLDATIFVEPKLPKARFVLGLRTV